MNRWKLILCLFLCARLARGETTLNLAAEVADENLAEEAILLVHCLAERSGHGWEFTGDARGALWLKVQENERQLRGTYHKDGKDHAFTLRAGGADEACDQLEPPAPVAPHPSLGKDAPLATEAPAMLRGEAEPEPGDPAPNRAWLWAAGGLAALVGGVLYWRSKQPAYRSVEMH